MALSGADKQEILILIRTVFDGSGATQAIAKVTDLGKLQAELSRGEHKQLGEVLELKRQIYALEHKQRGESLQLTQSQYAAEHKQRGELLQMERREGSWSGQQQYYSDQISARMRVGGEYYGAETMANYNKQFAPKQGILGEIGQDMGKVAMWTVATGAIFGTIAAVKKGFDTYAEFEKQTVMLQRVGDRLSDTWGDNAAAAQVLTKNVLDLKVAYGSTGTDALEAAVIYARLGQSASEVTQSVKTTLMVANLAGITASQAGMQMEAAMLQFKIPSEGLGHMADMLVKIDTVSRVTMKDLMESVSLSGGVWREAGGTLTELAAATSVVAQATSRSGSVIGNALKTISSRLGSEDIQEKIYNLTGVGIVDVSGNLKPIATVLREIAAIYPKLTEAERQELTIVMAGIRQRNILQALLDNQIGMTAQTIAGHMASGEAAKQNALEMDTLSKSYDKMGAAWERAANKGAVGTVGKGVVRVGEDIATGLTSGFGMGAAAAAAAAGLAIGLTAPVSVPTAIVLGVGAAAVTAAGVGAASGGNDEAQRMQEIQARARDTKASFVEMHAAVKLLPDLFKQSAEQLKQAEDSGANEVEIANVKKQIYDALIVVLGDQLESTLGISRADEISVNLLNQKLKPALIYLQYLKNIKAVEAEIAQNKAVAQESELKAKRAIILTEFNAFSRANMQAQADAKKAGRPDWQEHFAGILKRHKEEAEQAVSELNEIIVPLEQRNKAVAGMQDKTQAGNIFGLGEFGALKQYEKKVDYEKRAIQQASREFQMDLQAMHSESQTEAKIKALKAGKKGESHEDANRIEREALLATQRKLLFRDISSIYEPVDKTEKSEIKNALQDTHLKLLQNERSLKGDILKDDYASMQTQTQKTEQLEKQLGMLSDEDMLKTRILMGEIRRGEVSGTMDKAQMMQSPYDVRRLFEQAGGKFNFGETAVSPGQNRIAAYRNMPAVRPPRPPSGAVETESALDRMMRQQDEGFNKSRDEFYQMPRLDAPIRPPAPPIGMGGGINIEALANALGNVFSREQKLALASVVQRTMIVEGSPKAPPPLTPAGNAYTRA
jgi:TP901 family phage tail tape measure protein